MNCIFVQSLAAGEGLRYFAIHLEIFRFISVSTELAVNLL